MLFGMCVQPPVKKFNRQEVSLFHVETAESQAGRVLWITISKIWQVSLFCVTIASARRNEVHFFTKSNLLQYK
jgi:hypothetical protein